MEVELHELILVVGEYFSGAEAAPLEVLLLLDLLLTDVGDEVNQLLDHPLARLEVIHKPLEVALDIADDVGHAK